MDFVKALHSLGVLDYGEYVIISIDDFIFDPESNAQEYTSRSNEPSSYLNEKRPFITSVSYFARQITSIPTCPP